MGTEKGASRTYVRVILVSVFSVARMAGVRGLAFLVIQKRESRSEKLPLKLDLDNTSERTCMLHPSSLPSWCRALEDLISRQMLLTVPLGA